MVCAGGGLAGEASAARQAKLERYCAKNPERCERLKQRAGDWKARCEADPAACAAKKAAARDRLEEVKARCEADPAACAAKKEQLRERRDALSAPAAKKP